MRTICIWPDGFWCEANEAERQTYRSDDFERREVPEDASDEFIDQWIAERQT